MATHPAYPSPADLRTERDAAQWVAAAVANNARIAALLEETIAKLRECDLSGYSMIPGCDLFDIVPMLRHLMPRHQDPERLEMVREWARDFVAEVVS